MPRLIPLQVGDAVGLLAAMLETPLLAIAVPRACFPPGPATQLHALLAGHAYIHIEWDASAEGVPFLAALLAYCEAEQLHDAAELARDVTLATRAIPELLWHGRARLKDFARPWGFLDEPASDAPAPRMPRDAADGLRLHGGAAA